MNDTRLPTETWRDELSNLHMRHFFPAGHNYQEIRKLRRKEKKMLNFRCLRFGLNFSG